MCQTGGYVEALRLRLVVLIVLLAAIVGWVPFAGSFLIVAEEPIAADAIVVIAGNSPDRLPRAEELRAAGYAHLVIVSNERVHTHGLETTWWALYQAGISAPDLPKADVAVIDDPPPESTIDEAHRSADILVSRGLHSALLVTDAFHSRRASLLFRAVYAHRGLTVRSVPVPDALDLAHWWTHPLAARRVAEEWTKFVYYLVQGAYF